MTPTEARQIEQQEFLSECKAALKRALAYADRCRKLEKQKVKAWINDAKVVTINLQKQPVGRRPTMHEVNGVYRTMEGWAKCLGISSIALISRRKRLGSLEAAIAMGGPQRPGAKPGVVSNFAPSKETGARCSLQDSPNITFSGEDA